MIWKLKACERELKEFPFGILEVLVDLFARLEEGHILKFPTSRPMPSIGSGVHELRLRDRSGVYRVIFWIRGQGEIFVLHAFKKTTEATALHNIRVAKMRLKEIL